MLGPFNMTYKDQEYNIVHKCNIGICIGKTTDLRGYSKVIFLYFNGDKYEGEFKDGKRHGQGTYTFKDGRIYVGEFKDGASHGQGTIKYKDGSMYVGEFKDGKRHGQGTIKYKEGRICDGEWKDDKFNGKITFLNGDVLHDVYIDALNFCVGEKRKRDEN